MWVVDGEIWWHELRHIISLNMGKKWIYYSRYHHDSSKWNWHKMGTSPISRQKRRNHFHMWDLYIQKRHIWFRKIRLELWSVCSADLWFASSTYWKPKANNAQTMDNICQYCHILPSEQHWITICMFLFRKCGLCQRVQRVHRVHFLGSHNSMILRNQGAWLWGTPAVVPWCLSCQGREMRWP